MKITIGCTLKTMAICEQQSLNDFITSQSFRLFKAELEYAQTLYAKASIHIRSIIWTAFPRTNSGKYTTAGRNM